MRWREEGRRAKLIFLRAKENEEVVEMKEKDVQVQVQVSTHGAALRQRQRPLL